MELLKKMTKKEIKFRDPVVERVVDKFVLRSDVGYNKYGTTIEECIERAYNEIKDRTGKMSNGTFKKD